MLNKKNYINNIGHAYEIRSVIFWLKCVILQFELVK